MKPIYIIESPFRATATTSESEHTRYLDRIIRHVVFNLNGTPYASHQMLTVALDDADPRERFLGLKAGLDMSLQLLTHCNATALFCVDYGMSEGMTQAESRYLREGFRYGQHLVELRVGVNA